MCKGAIDSDGFCWRDELNDLPTWDGPAGVHLHVCNPCVSQAFYPRRCSATLFGLSVPWCFHVPFLARFSFLLVLLLLFPSFPCPFRIGRIRGGDGVAHRQARAPVPPPLFFCGLPLSPKRSISPGPSSLTSCFWCHPTSGVQLRSCWSVLRMPFPVAIRRACLDCFHLSRINPKGNRVKCVQSVQHVQ